MDHKNDQANGYKILFDKLWDFILLNVFFVLACIPVLTVGAANCAFYSAMCQLTNKKPTESVSGVFWHSFKLHFKRATLLWLMLLAGIIWITWDFYIVSHMDMMLKYCSYGLLAFVAILLQSVNMVGFPLLVEYDLPMIGVIRKTFVLLAQKPTSLIVVGSLYALPFLAASLAMRWFANLFLLWILVYYSLVEALRIYTLKPIL